MSVESQKIRCDLINLFEKGYTAAKAHREICAIHGQGTISERAVGKWFARFRNGNFDIKDAPRAGRPCTGKLTEILKKVKEDQSKSSRDIAKELGIHHTTVLDYLKKAGYTKKLDVWMWHPVKTKPKKANNKDK